MSTPVGQMTLGTLVSKGLAFVRHPGTSTGLGLALAGLAQFSAAVPPHDRTTPTLLGLGYALATQVIDWLKSRGATAA